MKLEIIKYVYRIFQRLKKSYIFKFCSRPTLRVTVLRWVTVLLCGWLAALVVYLFLPLIILIRPINLVSLDGYRGWYGALVLTHVLIAVMLVLYLQSKLYIRLPRRTFRYGYCVDIPRFLRYPSLHAAVISGVVLLFCLSDAGLDGSHGNNRNMFFAAIEKVTLLFRQDSSDRSSDLDLSAFGLIFFIGVYGVISVVRNETTLRNMNEKKKNLDKKEYRDLLTCDDKEFEGWISSNKTGKYIDFFDRMPYIDRIFRRLQNGISDNKRQFLSGKFGEGKTTIVELVERKLDDDWVVSWFDCWERSGKAEELATQFMEQIIHDVGQKIDASSLTSLPDSFAHALYGVSHWFSFLDPILRPDIPAEVVAKLDSLLEVNNRKLLIVVENVDRNEERDRFITVIAAMLDKLSGNEDIKNINFIFSADEDLIDTQIVYRISDYMERVETIVTPEVILRFMAMCLKSSLGGKLNGESLMIPYLKQGFTLSNDSDEQIRTIKEAFGFSPNVKNPMTGDSMELRVLNALADVLSNPRRLKYVLRHVNDLWASDASKLAGEVNLFDLILYITVSYDDELKKTIQNYPKEILEGNGDSPYSSRLRDAMNKQSANDQKSAPQSKQLMVNIIDHDNLVGKINTESANTNGLASSSITLDLQYSSGANFKNAKRSSGSSAREKIAFYLLNGQKSNGTRVRTLLCQPIIDEHGIAEESFRKYRKITDIGQVEGYADSDQVFLRKYINASGAALNTEATKAVLDFAMRNQDIFKSLVNSMTRNYFVSVTELYQFTYNAIVLAHFECPPMTNGPFHSIFGLCFSVINFDRNGGDDHAEAFGVSLMAAFNNLDKQKKYLFLIKMLWTLINSGADRHFSKVAKVVVEKVLKNNLARNIGLHLTENNFCVYDLANEYIYFITILKRAENIFSESMLSQAITIFLNFFGMIFTHDSHIIVKYHRERGSQLAVFYNYVRENLNMLSINGLEADVLREIYRVILASTPNFNTDDQD